MSADLILVGIALAALQGFRERISRPKAVICIVHTSGSVIICSLSEVRKERRLSSLLLLGQIRLIRLLPFLFPLPPFILITPAALSQP